MTSSRTETFERSVEDHDATAVRTTADAFESALSSAITPPAVGAPIPFDGVALSDEVTVDPTPEELERARTGVTPVGLGIAAYGTVAIQSRVAGDEPLSLYPERHVAVLRASDIVAGMGDAIEWFSDEIDAGRDSAVFATGPSATGDMGALIRGVHGPKEVHVVVVTDR